MRAGYDYGHNIHASVSTYRIESSEARPGIYTDVNGNTATAWGLIYASENQDVRFTWEAILSLRLLIFFTNLPNARTWA